VMRLGPLISERETYRQNRNMVVEVNEVVAISRLP